MHAAAFILMASLTSEQRLTQEFRSAKEISVSFRIDRDQWRTVTLHQPGHILRHLSVRKATDGNQGPSFCRLSFGSNRPWYLWPAGCDHDMTGNGGLLDIDRDFVRVLNEEVSRRLGGKVDVLEINEDVKAGTEP